MKTATFSLTFCFLTLSLHAKILVLSDLSDLRQLSLPSCEEFATVKFSNIKKDLDKKGISSSNGTGRIKVSGKFEYVNGVLCQGNNGSKVPGYVFLNGSGTFKEDRTYKECSNYEQYEWKYMIKSELWGKCDCQPKGVDSNGHDLYAAVYADNYTRDIIPGYMKRLWPGIYYINTKWDEEYKQDKFYMVC